MQVKNKNHEILDELRNNQDKEIKNEERKISDLINEKNENSKFIAGIPLHSLKNQIKELKNSVLTKDVCPTCGEKIPEDKRDFINNKIKDMSSKKNDYTIQIKKLISKNSEIENKILDINLTILDLKNKFEVIINKQKNKDKNKILSFQNEVEGKLCKVKKEFNSEKKDKKLNFEKDIKKLNLCKIESEKNKKKLSDDIERFKNLGSQEKIIENYLEFYTNSLKEEKNKKFDDNKIKSIQDKIIQNKMIIKDLRKDLNSNSNLVDIYTFWKEGFSKSGIESMLIDQTLPFLNERVKYYQDLISHGRYLIKFDTLKETKSGEFKDKTDITVLDAETLTDNKDLLSGGQERVVDISVILTLSDLLCSFKNVSFNILLFDEIFDSLDFQNIQNICNILIKLKQEKTIFIVSHRDVNQLEIDDEIKL